MKTPAHRQWPLSHERVSQYAAAVDDVRVKRLVRGLIVDLGLPCELLDVAWSESRWSVTIRDRRRRDVETVVRPARLGSL